MTEDQLLEPSTSVTGLRNGEYDFLDFGCSRGGSILMGQKLFAAKRGLGIDIAEKKVEEARAAGYDALVYNILDLPGKPLTRFCIMAHFLEHVPNRTDVVAFLRKASVVAREFVFIKQPYFDADGYLFQNGLKLYWSDWRGHPNTMSTLDFHSILTPMRNAGLIGEFSIHLAGPIASSSHKAVHPISSPIDQHAYDPEKHAQKGGEIKFSFPVFTETMVFISKPGVDHYRPFKKVKFDRTVFESMTSR